MALYLYAESRGNMRQLLSVFVILLSLVPAAAPASAQTCYSDWWYTPHSTWTSYYAGSSFEIGNKFTVSQTSYFHGWAVWYPADQHQAQGMTLWNADTGANLTGLTSGNVPAGWHVYQASAPYVQLNPGTHYMVSLGIAAGNYFNADVSGNTPNTDGADPWTTYDGNYYHTPYGHFPDVSGGGVNEIGPWLCDS